MNLGHADNFVYLSKCCYIAKGYLFINSVPSYFFNFILKCLLVWYNKIEISSNDSLLNKSY